MNRKRVNFRSDPFRNQADFIGVDRNTNTIMGAVVIQAGSLNDDRPWHIDETTLQQVVDFGNKRNKGLKARFTHPNVSEDGMGKMLGQWVNFRVDGDKVRADLRISKRADESPVGEIGSYVLGLAEDEPDMFGVSIVSELSEEMFEEDTDLFDEARGTTAFRLSALYAADVVDEPAATRGGLFDSNGLPDLPAQVTRVLDTHFSDATPDELLSRFEGFLQKYFKDNSIQFKVKEPEVADQPEVKAVEDIQLSQDEVVNTSTTEADLVEPEVVTSFSQEFGQKMLEKFGAEGLRLAFEGKNEIEIVEHFSSAKDAEIDSLRAQLAAAKEFQGEPEELSAGVEEAPKESRFEKLSRELKEKNVPYPEMTALISLKNEKK